MKTYHFKNKKKGNKLQQEFSIIKLDQNVKGCRHFKWSELVYLKVIDSYVIPSEKIKNELIITAQILEKIRKAVGIRPIEITSCYRPPLYNKHIGGVKRSQHLLGKAADFKVKGMNADKVRLLLEPHLEDFGIRMENYPGSSWIHIDRKEVKKNRYFKP